MNKIPMIIMAAGVSSRMKNSVSSSKITSDLINQSNTRVKGFIEVGNSKEPFIYYIISNCIKADIRDFYIILSNNSKEFQKYLRKLEKKLSININFAFQDFYGREKPLGTSDAIFQTMNQYEELKNNRFLVCNCDNLYSTKAIKLLVNESRYNSLIAYEYQCLEFSQDRLSSFSILNIENDFLLKIIEKPSLEIIQNHKIKKYVSMNIFSFIGEQVYPYFKDCPISSERGEKEIPNALQNMISNNKDAIITFPLCEHVPDITYKDDISLINSFLD